jgi:CDP-diacylglycerol--glycerol-3-phosphate 3-phosphatidyltransferase
VVSTLRWESSFFGLRSKVFLQDSSATPPFLHHAIHQYRYLFPGRYCKLLFFEPRSLSSTHTTVRHLPNILTLYRILLSPVFIGIFLVDALWAKVACLILIITFMITDFLDGYIARKQDLVTDSGKLLDPLADKICNFSVFLCFLIHGYAHVWMIAAIFYRDALINLLRAFAAAKDIIIAARNTGKIKTALQGVAMVVIVALIVMEQLTDGSPTIVEVKQWSNWIMGVVAVVTVLSLGDYVKANWEIIRRM